MKTTFLEKTKSILNIFLLALFTYSSMVFISHFAENNGLENYKYWHSFEAIYTKSNIASEFIIGFGVFTVVVVLFAVLIRFIFKSICKNKKP